MDFGKYAEYMALGYAVMAAILGGMVAWIAYRYQMLVRDQRELDRIEAEERK